MSPLSELAVRYAEKIAGHGVVAESTARAANDYVAAALGIPGEIHQPAAAVIDKYGQVSTESNYVGKLLASMSGLSADFGYEQSFEYMLLALDKNDLNTPAYLLSFGAQAVDRANQNLHLVASMASDSPIFAQANEIRLAVMDGIKREIRVQVLSNIGPEDAAGMTADTVAHLSAEDMKYIPAEALAHINASQLAAAQLTYLSGEQMEALYGLQVQTGDLGTNSDFTLDRRPELFGTLNAPLPQGASLAIIAGEDQIGTATLSEDRLTWTFEPSEELDTLPYAIGVAVSTPEMSSLQPGKPLNLDIRDVAMLSTSEIGQLPADHLSNIDAASFDGLTIDQLEALTVAQLAVMSNEQKLHAFSPSVDSLFSNGHQSTSISVSADGLELHGSLKAPIPDGITLSVPLFADGQLAGEIDVTGATWIWRPTSPMQDGLHYFSAGSAVSAKFLIATVDSTSPHISSIFAFVNGSMSLSAQVGNELRFMMLVDEVVTVDTTAGTPTLDIIIGSTVRHLAMTPANGSLLEFSYRVADDDIDLDGVTLGEEALSLNGASIRDLAGNDIVLDSQFYLLGSMRVGVANFVDTNPSPFPT
ncbi:hypothetical protein NDN16_04300 [Aureimonas altamirensis]|uniref:hypothetical protein n=1 Tax=Aureimonas altamirensis TaxID=370622 RepID=UPI002553DDE9|nr:hypothetical protein [Aureimonas altamirensis]MCM2502896.1 hypothetical protein [Aureimonas altamirensis]